jgi:hypothetical protein
LPVHDDSPSLTLLVMNVVTVLYSEMLEDVKSMTGLEPEGRGTDQTEFCEIRSPHSSDTGM